MLMAQASFTATTDAKSVALGEVFEIKFTVENGQGANFRPPSFSEFNVAAGPNRMNSMTIVNGVSKSSESYSYVLQAKREGIFTIGVAQIDIGGKTYRTNPLSINVVRGRRQTGGDLPTGKDDIIIRAEVSNATAFVGQQILVDYKLYTRVNINGVNRVNESNYDGFFKQDVNDFPKNDNRISIGGKPYLSRTLQRVALFPQREGRFAIEPFSLQVGVVKNNRANDDDPFGQFFSMPEMDNRVVQSNSLTIQVQPFPQPMPNSFTGAVGDFKADFQISKTDATTDDAISLKIWIHGNGDAKRWQPPKIAAVEGLDIYEPKVLNETHSERQGEWQTTKEIEYLIVPKRTGRFNLKPEFSYLNTVQRTPSSGESARFETLSPNTSYQLNITQGSNKAAKIADDRPKDIFGIRLKTAFTDQITRFFGSSLFWFLLVMPFLFFAGVVGYKQWQIQLGKRDMMALRRANAPKVAEGRLAVAHEFLKKGNTRLFYDEVSKALFNYVSHKFGIPLSEFSKSNVREKLQSVAVNTQHIENLVGILNDCEIALFAGRDTEGVAEAIYDRASQVIIAIEEDLK
jgi:hypothetical protein